MWIYFALFFTFVNTNPSFTEASSRKLIPLSRPLLETNTMSEYLGEPGDDEDDPLEPDEEELPGLAEIRRQLHRDETKDEDRDPRDEHKAEEKQEDHTTEAEIEAATQRERIRRLHRSRTSVPRTPIRDDDADLRAFEYIFQQLLGEIEHLHLLPQNKLYRALKNHGTYFRPGDFTSLHDDDIAALQYRENRSLHTIAKAQMWKVKVLRLFSFEREELGVEDLNDPEFWESISLVEFKSHEGKMRRALNFQPLPSGPGTVSAINKVTDQSSRALENFKKGVKRDATPYPELKKDSQWNRFKRGTYAQAQAQGLGHLLNLGPPPPLFGKDLQLYRMEAAFLYGVFDLKVTTALGMSVLTEFANDRDGNKVFRKLVQVYDTNSSRAKQVCFEILQWLTTVRLGSTMLDWTGTTENFVLHFLNQVTEHTTLAPSAERLNDSLLLILLQNAVSEVPALAQIKANADIEAAKPGGSLLPYSAYRNLLLTACHDYDNRVQTSKAAGTANR